MTSTSGNVSDRRQYMGQQPMSRNAPQSTDQNHNRQVTFQDGGNQFKRPSVNAICQNNQIQETIHISEKENIPPTNSHEAHNISDQMVIPVTINGANLKFLVDTGSAINVIHNSEMQPLQPTVHIRIPKHNFASTVDGSAAQVFGEVQLKIIINGQTYTDQFSIMNCGQCSGILGQPFLNII